jgi:peptide chain release factor 2
LAGFFEIATLKQEKEKIEKKMAQPDFWGDPLKAKELNEKHALLEKEITQFEELEKKIDELLLLAKETEKNKEEEWWPEIERQYLELKKEFDKLEFLKLFSDKYDRKDAIMAIHAGVGGVDAQDWAEMLFRMYLRFCQRRGFTVNVLDKSEGGEAGLKSVTFEVRGPFAYGWLKSENGVHRLVRISPFDAEKMRHTSFALVEVLPVLGEVEITLNSKDLRIDTFLSSGHGGQSVQTTYSAVRIVHLPTGITVTCQNERSQQQNKEIAMKILRAKLHALAELEQRKEKRKLRGEYKEAAWGNQIRSYVLHPYHLVKDLRTGYETSEVEAVLDGELESLIETYLRQAKSSLSDDKKKGERDNDKKSSKNFKND